MPIPSASASRRHPLTAPLWLVACFLLLTAEAARGDGLAFPGDPPRDRAAFMLGLGQWALGGGNVAVQGNLGPLALEYSHGWGVHLSSPEFLRNASERDAGADVHETWTTGFGVGLLVTHNLRLLVEFKANHYELVGGARTSTLGYTTFTVGPGVFYDIHLWKGLFVQPSLRWWPTVRTTLPAGATLARADGTRVAIQSHASGVFPNLNLGWEF
jgi:hypothetical protein